MKSGQTHPVILSHCKRELQQQVDDSRQHGCSNLLVLAPKLIFRFNAIPIKMPARCFIEIHTFHRKARVIKIVWYRLKIDIQMTI